jgi:uncharacterized protein (TIGR00251 family)
MLQLETHACGVILSVKAQAGAGASGLRGVHDGAVRVAVTQVAEKGKANKAIVALLAKRLCTAKSAVELLSGATSSRKKFLIRGVQLEDVRRALECD